MSAGAEVELYQPGQLLALNHDTSQVVEAITMNTAGAELSKFDALSQARVPGPGGKRWKVRHADGTEEDPQTLTGVIVSVERARSYWKKPFMSGGEMPDCASYDGGFTGVANTPDGPCMKCENCPMNKFQPRADGTGNVKPCKETRQVLLLPADSLLPILVSVPPASLRIFNGFMVRNANLDRGDGNLFSPYYTFAVELSIGTTSTEQYKDVPCVKPTFLGLLEPKEAELARSYSEALKAIFARNAMNPNGTDPDPGNGAAETDEQRAERLAAQYGDTIPTDEEA
jgi:hypothetical protein